ncbi:flagellar L-ring protein precursor FlgH [Sphingomonas laterariae]|uniref:Flagellar L-ring protein n=1 Tax=Edaphosphingomonas laterariae TaxID=861865 RepID=A0A239HU84_9SPHN|nr:flagellar basal body L-ring protein FlgH [Sphingomonas laterariae]SNS84343.1 flagellar L-ring protein precursor FlgH [Sphingomonas laterariae]
MRRALAIAVAAGVSLGLGAAPATAGLFGPKKPKPDYAPAYAPPPPPPPANGAIFQAANGYAALTSGARASMVGDVLTILLVERTQASKSAAANTDRSGSLGLTPPTTGPLSFFDPSDVTASGGAKFDGKGAATQSNALSGEISVTIAAVYPNGTFLVRGEKLLTLNRGDEMIRISGLVRAADISTDNRVLSTRVADARISYAGKGDVARASKPGWLSQFFSIISPF